MTGKITIGAACTFERRAAARRSNMLRRVARVTLIMCIALLLPISTLPAQSAGESLDVDYVLGELFPALSEANADYFDTFDAYSYDFELEHTNRPDSPDERRTRKILGSFTKTSDGIVYAEGYIERRQQGGVLVPGTFQIGSDGNVVHFCQVLGDAGNTPRYEQFVIDGESSIRALSLLASYAWDAIPYVERLGDRRSKFVLGDQLRHLEDIASKVTISAETAGDIYNILVTAHSGIGETYLRMDRHGLLIQRERKILHRDALLLVENLEVAYEESGPVKYPAFIEHVIIAPFDVPETQFHTRVVISNFTTQPAVITPSSLENMCPEAWMQLVYDGDGRVIEELSLPSPSPARAPRPSSGVDLPGGGARAFSRTAIYFGILFLAIGALALVHRIVRR